ncbi:MULTISPECIES: hypothetical protein [Catenuloplanes]|uniref:Uncharacterized protein n=1 Tax=Catenuloplanes niger TaxID=587534 RepID=A0AAE3ZLH4_9ACTN|nr:hypothetical protein [Catenuloplanes niger]MDR7320070.1 hypothetical protein [Catenuloplanes niger]
MIKRLTALVVIVPLVVLTLLWIHANPPSTGDDFSRTICELRRC